jgi:hypothetical protein
MTIRNIPVREFNDRLTKLERCSECAPTGTFDRAKDAGIAVSEASEVVREVLRIHKFRAVGNDRLRILEATIYWYLTESNPDELDLITGEGFGDAMDGPAATRVLAQTIRDRDFLRDNGL